MPRPFREHGPSYETGFRSVEQAVELDDRHEQRKRRKSETGDTEMNSVSPEAHDGLTPDGQGVELPEVQINLDLPVPVLSGEPSTP